MPLANSPSKLIILCEPKIFLNLTEITKNPFKEYCKYLQSNNASGKKYLLPPVRNLSDGPLRTINVRTQSSKMSHQY